MFIRKKENISKRTGLCSTYYELVESIRTENGSTNRVLLYLGKLEITLAEQKTLSSIIDRKVKGFSREVRFSDKIEELAELIYQKYKQKFGRPQLEKGNDESEEEQYTFLKESLETGYHRSIGLELVGMHFWKMLKFEKILKSCDFSLSQIELAEIAILGRLISPGSEKHMVWWFNKQSSLAEFLQLEKIGLGKDRLYRIGDKLLEHKSEIERSLRKNLKSLHILIDRVYLYDLTNTYFEGNKLNSTLCKRGKSKEKRDDCPLVTLALVVDQDGFPVFSKIYSGNQSEPLTLQEVLAELKDSEDFIDRCATPAIVMDRGIATKDNILLLEQEGYKYFVIERRNSVKEFAQEFKALEGFSESKDKHQGKLYLKKIVSDTKARVLVYSEARAIKERGITTRWEKNFLEDIKRLNDSIQKGNISTADKIWVKIGWLKEKYGSTAANYEIQLQPSNSAPQRIESLIITDRHKKSCKAEFPGCYVIETNHTDFSAEEIWKV